jgi:hypothetical protein
MDDDDWGMQTTYKCRAHIYMHKHTTFTDGRVYEFCIAALLLVSISLYIYQD